MKIIIWKKCGN